MIFYNLFFVSRLHQQWSWSIWDFFLLLLHQQSSRKVGRTFLEEFFYFWGFASSPWNIYKTKFRKNMSFLRLGLESSVPWNMRNFFRKNIFIFRAQKNHLVYELSGCGFESRCNQKVPSWNIRSFLSLGLQSSISWNIRVPFSQNLRKIIFEKI